MADNKHFRIIVDLSSFFCDHRRVARVFVKSNLRSISDVQNRITELFKINDFYLTTGGHFLPASEDVRVLSQDESVCVIPNKPSNVIDQSSSKVTSSLQPTEHEKQKRSLEVIPEDSGETSIPKKKKHKKKQANVTSDSSEDEVPRKKKKKEEYRKLTQEKVPTTGTTEIMESIKKKIKQKGNTIDPKYFNSKSEDVTSYKSKQNESIVEKAICNIESAQKISDIKKQLQQKTEKYINKHSKTTASNSLDVSSKIRNVLPKLQSHIKNCNDLGRSTLPDTVHLSRHVDTPIKTFSRYTPPQRITDQYLAKNKINVVKIDIIKKVSEESNVSQSSACSEKESSGISNTNLEKCVLNRALDKSLQKNEVKDNISSEQNISCDSIKLSDAKVVNDIENKMSEVIESEASNYTKAFLDQSNPNISNSLEYKTNVTKNSSIASMDITPVRDTTLDEVNYVKDIENGQSLQTTQPQIEEPLKEDVESTDISIDISSIPRDSIFLNGNSNNSSLTSSELDISSGISRHKANRIFLGVGSLIGRLRETDSVLSQESDTSGQYVTKRKRIRKHRRKNKKTDDTQKPSPVKIESEEARPMNTKACPKIHIKFENEDINMEEENKPVNTEHINHEDKMEEPKHKPKQIFDKCETKSVVMESVVLSDENDDPIMETKSIFGEESISKAPLMTAKLEPKVGDVIAFKVLKMTDKYTPVVSNYIVGKLEIYLLENKTVYFKILQGEDELLPPSGKLSLREDEDMQDSKYKEFSWNELIDPKLLFP